LVVNRLVAPSSEFPVHRQCFLSKLKARRTAIRPDYAQVVIAVVVTTGGFPLAGEGMNGNIADLTTLSGFLDKIENTYGNSRRMWVMDRGIPTEALLAKSKGRQAKEIAKRAYGLVKVLRPIYHQLEHLRGCVPSDSVLPIRCR